MDVRRFWLALVPSTRKIASRTGWTVMCPRAGPTDARPSPADQCQAACADDPQCKAFAFKSANSACHLYDRVYPGGSKMTRNLGMRSSGLSIVPRRGYISAFKTSSFPPPPTWKR